MVATVGATSGMDRTWLSSWTMLRPQSRPKIATKIGRTIAVTVPKTRTRMSMAAAMPTSSDVCVSGLESLLPSWPPASTCTPASAAGSRAASSMSCACSFVRSPRATDGTTVE
jgi:hypothetical protein